MEAKNMFLNNQQIIEEIKKEIKICIETNENENMTTQNLWDSETVVLRGSFIAIQAYLRKQEKNQINNPTLHLKQLDKEEMENPRVSRRKERKKESAVVQSFLTLCNPMDCSLPGSSIHGIFQSRVMEWLVISFSRGSSGPRH